MLIAATWVFVRHRSFGIGGGVLTVFGAILLGMPVWRTVDVSVDQSGVSAKFEQLETQIVDVKRETATKISQVEKRTEGQVSQLQRRTNALEQAQAIQAFYNEHKSRRTCMQYREIVKKISAYVGKTELVPEHMRYTVRYPSKKDTPTISDLATDRITRVKQVRSECFR